MLKSWSFFDPSIKLVLFTDSEYWKERAREVGITWTEAFALLLLLFLICRLNPNGLPYFSSMTEYLQDHYVSRFYGYVNGDIIFHSTLRDVLLRINHAIPSPHLLVVGRRYNAYFKSGTLSSLSSASAVDRYIKSQIRFSEQFIPVAQDYFLFTENTFTRHNLLPVVVGRNRYDNYLLTLCKTTSTCRLADASEARRALSPCLRLVIALHLSDASGDFAGTKARVDADWNARLIGDNHHFNSVAPLTASSPAERGGCARAQRVRGRRLRARGRRLPAQVRHGGIAVRVLRADGGRRRAADGIRDDSSRGGDERQVV